MENEQTDFLVILLVALSVFHLFNRIQELM